MCIKVYNIHGIQLHIILKNFFHRILQDLLICIYFTVSYRPYIAFYTSYSPFLQSYQK